MCAVVIFIYRRERERERSRFVVSIVEECNCDRSSSNCNEYLVQRKLLQQLYLCNAIFDVISFVGER